MLIKNSTIICVDRNNYSMLWTKKSINTVKMHVFNTFLDSFHYLIHNHNNYHIHNYNDNQNNNSLRRSEHTFIDLIVINMKTFFSNVKSYFLFLFCSV